MAMGGTHNTYNIALGHGVMYDANSTSYTIAIGDLALAKNRQGVASSDTTSGIHNTAIGSKAFDQLHKLQLNATTPLSGGNTSRKQADGQRENAYFY